MSEDQKCRKHCLKAWDVLHSEKIFSADPWITVIRQEVMLPTGKIIKDYHRIDLGDFVVIFAQTKDGKIVVERQYKHGAGEIGLVMPAGAVEAGEESIVAAERELLEETGYKSDHWESLGSYVPNGNYGCGLAHMFMANNAYKVQEPASGDLEDMDIILMDKDEISKSLIEGEFHMLGSIALIALVQTKLNGY